MDKHFKNIEIYHDGKDEHLYLHNLDSGNVVKFSPVMKDFIHYCLETIKERYPVAFSWLVDMYPRGSKDYKYEIVRQFFRCNFFINDNTPDIDGHGRWNLELVPCPCRGNWCNIEGIVCKPELNTTLSEREKEVARNLINNNNNKEETAEELFISIRTVENHRRNIYEKLKIHSFTEMHSYFIINKLMEQ